MLLRQTSADGVVFHVSPLLRSAGVPHAFSTRLGGVSPAPFDSLNLGNPGGCPIQDAAEHLQENYRRLQAAISCQERGRCWVHQVHGTQVHAIRPTQDFASGCEGDALVCDDPQRLVGVRIADCVPILLASEDGRAVAAVHAGWRGVIQGVVPAAVATMRQLWPDRVGNNGHLRLLAAIGPCIGIDAFEVGPEVLAEFSRVFGPETPTRPGANGKGHVDLRQAVRMQLMRCGVPDRQIDVSDSCTCRDREEFYSHRRDKGITGRMAAVIGTR